MEYLGNAYLRENLERRGAILLKKEQAFKKGTS
jgi:hypothetical protein